MEQIRRDGKLVSRIDSARSLISADLANLHALEDKYDFASKLISSCAISAGLILFSFLVFKFLV
jgi:hypothetical protein